MTAPRYNSSPAPDCVSRIKSAFSFYPLLIAFMVLVTVFACAVSNGSFEL